MANGNRFLYETATFIDQDFLDNCADNLTNQLELGVEIDTPGGIIVASDRNKYIGALFYEARLTFPVIRRTIGDFLSGELEFSELQLELSNVDQIYNYLLPGGDSYDGFINRLVTVRLGLRDVNPTYKTIFSGRVTEVAGFGRTNEVMKLKVRDTFDELTKEFPSETLDKTTYPDLAEDLVGTIIPVIYGEFTTNVTQDLASVPAFAVNGADPDVSDDAGLRNDISFVISSNDLESFDTANVYVRRGSEFFKVTSTVTAGAGNKSFTVEQDVGTFQIDGSNYVYDTSDEFFVRVKGKDLGAYSDNIVWQARDILITYGGITVAEFDASWQTYRDKSSPSQSNIAAFKSRVWIQDPQSVMSYALSMLEQVRLEAFVNRDLDLEIRSLHFEDFEADPDFTINNSDVVRGTLQPNIDDRNNFNRARGVYNFLPDQNDNANATNVFKNAAAITQAQGKEISKTVVFPNLYEQNVVEMQVQEILKLTSSYLEIVDLSITWRGLLLDIGDFVSLNVQIGATVYNQVPCMVRSIGYDPQGVTLPLRLWSFQMTPYGTYNPGFSGTVGGASATIVQE